MGCTASRPLAPPAGADVNDFAAQGEQNNSHSQGTQARVSKKQAQEQKVDREQEQGNKHRQNSPQPQGLKKQESSMGSAISSGGSTSAGEDTPDNQRQRRNSSNGEKQRRNSAIARRRSVECEEHAKNNSDSNNNSNGRVRRSSGSSDSARSGSSKGMQSGSGSSMSEEEFFGLDMNYNEMELRESIGSGTYGQVFKCRYKGKMFALKKVFLPEAPVERAEMLEDFAKEVGILSVLRHDRIVTFKGAVRKHPTYALLFELCEGCVGTLLRMVRRRKVQVTWSICVTIAKDCAEAVSYLHSLRPRILHRDLKSENLLLTSRFRCKLTDFGLSRVYEGRKRTMTVCGTPCWVAPEIFRGEPYNEKIDVYSFGVVLWELFVGKKPYTEYESVELPYRVGKKGLRPPLLRHCPPSVNRLMKDCWHENAALRPTFPEIEKRLALIENELDVAGVINSPAHQTKVSWGEQLALSSANTESLQRRSSSSRPTVGA